MEQDFFVTSDLYFESSTVSIEHFEFVKHIYLFFFLDRYY